MARTKQPLSGDKLRSNPDLSASGNLGEENAETSPEMDISNEIPNQDLPLDINIKKCQNVQYYIEAYTETIQKITEVEAIIKKTQLLPFLYGPQDHNLHREEMDRWNEELRKIEGKGKATTKTNNRNKPFISNEIRPNTTYAQALQPKPDQQRAALDGKSAEATSEPKEENIPNNNSQYHQTESTDDFTIFDAIKELESFFQLFPGLMGNCKQMKNALDKTD
ncbi:hypothetical protein NPIL_382771 [Nephila pilipes]|uniref:Uncharacterized protein n=1 Tax=Nephila pilipes TaxID=299642 RepID=A0A8X6QJD1_NEPPI|nr:hypothetical protein NPIL_382771 [Nephila pilipes]